MAATLKFLTLMNPPRRASRGSRNNKHMKIARSRRGRFTRRSSRSRTTVARRPARRARRVRTNPPKMTPAMRKKISLAVKRSFRARAKSGAVARRSPARRTSVVVRRSSSISPALRAKISAGVRRSQAARRGGLRRFTGGSRVSFGKGILGMVSKDTLMIAGGAVAASVGTGIILNKFGSKLPGMSSATPGVADKARAVYSVALPVVAAYLIRNKQRRLAEGLVIGGLIMGFNSLLRSFAPSVGGVVQGPMGNFYETSGARGMGLAGEVPLGMGEYVQGSNPGTLASDLASQAFPSSAW